MLSLQLADPLQEVHSPNTSHGDGGIIFLIHKSDISFYINLPIGAITIFSIAFLLPVPHQPLTSLPLKDKFDEIDFLGLTFLLPYTPLSFM